MVDKELGTEVAVDKRMDHKNLNCHSMDHHDIQLLAYFVDLDLVDKLHTFPEVLVEDFQSIEEEVGRLQFLIPDRNLQCIDI